MKNYAMTTQINIAHFISDNVVVIVEDFSLGRYSVPWNNNYYRSAS